MFLKKLRGVRIVGRKPCDGSNREKQTESHRVPHLALFTYLLTDHMFYIFFVLAADILSDVVACIELGRARDFPGLGVSSWIVDGEFDFEMPQIGPPEALDDVHLFGVGMAHVIEPGSIVEADAVDYQRVAFPMSDGMPHPHGIRIFGMTASVQEDLAMAWDIILEKHYEQSRRLNQLEGKQSPGIGDASRQAMRSGRVLGVVRGSFLEQSLGPRQRLWLAGIHCSLREPDAGEVGLAVGGSRRWTR